jgi:thiamine-monophosphate kinase
LNKQSDIQHNEFSFIEWIKDNSPLSDSVVLGIGDDTAVLDHQRNTLISSDTILEGTHFTRETPLELVGRKALACNLSDIAAMGGRPLNALVNLILPKNLKKTELEILMSGIFDLAREYDVSICGGDTTSWDGPLGISITITGEAIKAPITRAGANIGDEIYITGALGNSLDSQHHLNFTPRIKLANEIVNKLTPTSMIDVTDGLAQDLGHILKSSNVGATLNNDLIPLREGADLKRALTDGEDFELCLTIAPNDTNLIDSSFGLIKIGNIDSSVGLTFTQPLTFDLSGFNHMP